LLKWSLRPCSISICVLFYGSLEKSNQYCRQFSAVKRGYMKHISAMIIDYMNEPGRLPDFIYKALPYLYFGLGLITVFWAKNGMAVFSGITLMTAGGIVWTLRHQYRKAVQGSGNKSGVPKKSIGEPGDGVVQIRWRKSFECGHAVIDAQHRQLFVLGNELINDSLTDKPKEDVQWLLENLLQHIIEHFTFEESILAGANHPVYETHKGLHAALLAKAEKLCDRFRKRELAVSELVGFIVYDVITDHLIKEDVRFSVYR